MILRVLLLGRELNQLAIELQNNITSLGRQNFEMLLCVFDEPFHNGQV